MYHGNHMCIDYGVYLGDMINTRRICVYFVILRSLHVMKLYMGYSGKGRVHYMYLLYTMLYIRDYSSCFVYAVCVYREERITFLVGVMSNTSVYTHAVTHIVLHFV